VPFSWDEEMEPQKRVRYSKLMELPEIEEILMEDESDEELEELNKLIEGTQNASSPASSHLPPSSDEEEKQIEFRGRRETDTAYIHDYTGLPNGVKLSAAPNISPEATSFTILFSSGTFLQY
jgi:hypothetical protein